MKTQIDSFSPLTSSCFAYFRHISFLSPPNSLGIYSDIVPFLPVVFSFSLNYSSLHWLFKSQISPLNTLIYPNKIKEIYQLLPYFLLSSKQNFSNEMFIINVSISFSNTFISAHCTIVSGPSHHKYCSQWNHVSSSPYSLSNLWHCGKHEGMNEGPYKWLASQDLSFLLSSFKYNLPVHFTL